MDGQSATTSQRASTVPAAALSGQGLASGEGHRDPLRSGEQGGRNRGRAQGSPMASRMPPIRWPADRPQPRFIRGEVRAREPVRHLRGTSNRSSGRRAARRRQVRQPPALLAGPNPAGPATAAVTGPTARIPIRKCRAASRVASIVDRRNHPTRKVRAEAPRHFRLPGNQRDPCTTKGRPPNPQDGPGFIEGDLGLP